MDGVPQVLEICVSLGADDCFGKALTAMSTHPTMREAMSQEQAHHLYDWLTGLDSWTADEEVCEKILEVVKSFISEELTE